MSAASPLEPAGPTEPAALPRALSRVVSVIAVAMSLYHLYAIAITPPEAITFRATHLAFALTLVFLVHPWRKGTAARRSLPVDLVLVALSLTVTGYILLNYDYLTNRIYYVDDPRTIDVVFAVMTMMLFALPSFWRGQRPQFVTRPWFGWGAVIVTIGWWVGRNVV